MTVPVRALPVFAAALNPTEPLPLPLVPEVTVIHDAPLVAVQAQPMAAETAKVPDPPPAAADPLVGLRLYVQAGAAAAACVTVKVCPSIVSVPLRAVPELAATLNDTEPFPFPLAPEATVIQEALLTAVHAHPAAVVTEAEPLPRPAPTD